MLCALLAPLPSTHSRTPLQLSACLIAHNIQRQLLGRIKTMCVLVLAAAPLLLQRQLLLVMCALRACL
jgi:hypothetical protein